MSTRHLVAGLTGAALLLSCLAAHADEGMWPLYELDKLNYQELQARGLALDKTAIYNPAGPDLADAIVELSGGTASFISADGLLITNHHVAFDAVQAQSTPENNYIEKGFYAPTRADELPAIGYDAYVVLSIEDVTAKVKQVVKDKMTDMERYKAIDKVKKAIIAKAEAGRDVRCSVEDMYDGLQYMLYTHLKIKDIRMVYIPPEAIGNYGGDIDNWMWPRHTGDFAFMRAYVAPDGSTADYAKENVPYRPKSYLPISSAGVREGDLTLILGFPGRTQRYSTSFVVDNLVNFFYPLVIQTYGDLLKIINTAGEQDPSAGIRMAGTASYYDNYYKNSIATIEGMKKANILEQKRRTEIELKEFLNSTPEMAKKYGSLFPTLDSLHRVSMVTRDKDFFMGWFLNSTEYMRFANMLWRWADQREKPNAERDAGYQNRDTLPARVRMEEAQVNLVPSVDKENFKYFIRKILALPSSQKIAVIEDRFAGTSGAERDRQIDQWTDQLYEGTAVGSLDQRLKMFAMKKKDLEGLNDPFIALAKSLQPELQGMRDRRKEHDGAHAILGARMVEAFMDWKKGQVYPDANGTMRLSYGTVVGYTPRDAVSYKYMTGLTGVMEKESGVVPFIVPPELKSVYQKKDFGRYLDPVIKDIPVDYLTTNDGTGGNSGSPVLNGKGEIIGLDFDSNYESVAKDYWYMTDISRSITLDIRYVLFLLDKVYHLDGLMKELTIH
jgi:hypothetical protein